MRASLIVELSASNAATVTFSGSLQAQGLHVQKDAIKGWWSSPSVKTSLTERQTGDGAFRPAQVLYSARTVTLPFALVNYTHEIVQQYRNSIGRLMGRSDVRMTVHDGDNPATYVTGYIQPEYSDLFQQRNDTGSITLVCNDPCRYSVEVQQSAASTFIGASQGLQFGNGGTGGLLSPLNFGTVDYNRNTVYMTNHGSYTAYPVVYLNGWYGNCQLTWHTGNGASGVLSYANLYVKEQPFIIDCKTRTASMGGSDVTSYITSYQFPSVEPGDTLVMSGLSDAAGYYTVQLHDCWM